jgi:hypothetical protein
VVTCTNKVQFGVVLKPLLTVVPTKNAKRTDLFNIDSGKRNLTELQIPVLKMPIFSSRNKNWFCNESSEIKKKDIFVHTARYVPHNGGPMRISLKSVEPCILMRS